MSQKEFTSMISLKVNLAWLPVPCYFSCCCTSSMEELKASL